MNDYRSLPDNAWHIWSLLWLFDATEEASDAALMQELTEFQRGRPTEVTICLFHQCYATKKDVMGYLRDVYGIFE
jgi:hypothetical protein